MSCFKKNNEIEKINRLKMKLAIIGVTGLVGQEILKVLEEFSFPISELIPVASEKSIGKKIQFVNKEYIVCSIEQAILQKPDIAIYSAGSTLSLNTAEQFAIAGTFVIDNSSAWRMNPSVPLVVPEVNLYAITNETRIIANPNCSTIQLVVVLNPLHKLYNIRKLVISTYQSVTGTGAAAIEQLFGERKGVHHTKVYPYQIDLNCFPHGGSFLENGYTTEEMKLIEETHKILGDNSIEISPTVVRIPVIGGHSESVCIEFEKNVQIEEIRQILENTDGIIVQDNPNENVYPMPILAQGKNETFVGRIRADLFRKNACLLWLVADNLRKGAATNAVQIAQYVYEKYVVK